MGVEPKNLPLLFINDKEVPLRTLGQGYLFSVWIYDFLRRYKELFSYRIVAESILSSEIANHSTEVFDYFLISGSQEYDEL